MIPANLLIGQVLIVLALVLCGLWTATQWTAAELGFQLRLGAPWFVVGGLPFYYPWRLFQWWYAYEAYRPAHLLNRRWIAAGGSLFAAPQRSSARSGGRGSRGW